LVGLEALRLARLRGVRCCGFWVGEGGLVGWGIGWEEGLWEGKGGERFLIHEGGDFGFVEEGVIDFLALGEGCGDCFVVEDIGLGEVWGGVGLPFGNEL